MKIRYTLPVVAAVLALTLAGCTNTEGGTTGGATDAPEIQPDDAAVALLPAEVKDAGKLIIGSDLDYAPNEFLDSNGDPAGWGVELANAVSAKLGLEPDWNKFDFDSILPRIEGGTVDMGSSSFTDTAERQQTVDFVNFLNAGTQWVSQKGKDVDPDNACGLTVAVQDGTTQADELATKNTACTDAGKDPIEILPFDSQADAADAVAQGRADAFSADSPVSGDAVIKRPDELQLTGDLFDAAPYGFATQKGSDMTKAVQAALQSLMDDGTYLEILKGAGLEAGALETATINAGE